MATKSALRNSPRAFDAVLCLMYLLSTLLASASGWGLLPGAHWIWDSQQHNWITALLFASGSKWAHRGACAFIVFQWSYLAAGAPFNSARDPDVAVSALAVQGACLVLLSLTTAALLALRWNPRAKPV